jgi:hypothetical protein
MVVLYGPHRRDVNSRPVRLDGLRAGTFSAGRAPGDRGTLPGMSDIVPRSTLARQGVQGVVFLVGGIVLVVVAAGGLLGIIAGALAVVVGLALTGSKQDRSTGIIATMAGVVVLAAGIFGRQLGWLLWPVRVAGIILAGLGGYWIWKFVANLRKRM